MKQTIYFNTIVFLLTVTCLTIMCFASEQNTFTFQGRLENSNGIPISSTVNMTFKLYDNQNNNLWSETLPVNVFAGEYNLVLGQSNPIGLTVNEQVKYLGLTVEGDSEMEPRQEIAGVLRAGMALGITDLAITTSKLADNAVTSEKIDNNAITSDKINSSAITSAKIANSSVIAGKLSASGGTSLPNGTSGQSLLSNGDGTFAWGTVSDTIIVPVAQQTFRTSTYSENLSTGSHKYTISSDDIYIKLVVVGGGAGGGGGETGYGGGGGGAGGAIEVFLLKGTHFNAGDVLSFSGGAGGAKGEPLNGNGVSGTSTMAYKNGSEICRGNNGTYGSTSGHWCRGGNGGSASITISAPYIVYQGGDGVAGNMELSTVSNGGVGGQQVIMGWGEGGRGAMGRSDGTHSPAYNGVQGGAFLLIYRKVSL
jgi:hypothetical protein